MATMKKQPKNVIKRITSFVMIMALVLELTTAVDIMYPSSVAHAASFSTSGTAASAPVYNKANFPTLDITGTGSSTATPTRKYYYGKNGEAFYGVTDKSSSGIWELVDTDCRMAGKDLRTIWNSSKGKGCTILNTVNGWTDTYFNSADKAGMKQTSISTDVMAYDSNYSIISNHYSTTTLSSYLYPLSASQLVTSGWTAGGTGSRGLTKNGLATALYNNIGNVVWSRSFSGCNSGNYYGWIITSLGVDNSFVNYYYCMAPAFNLDLSKVLIARSATSGTTSQSFATASSNAVAGSASGDLKFLVNAGTAKGNFNVASINGKTISNILAGKTYEFDYTGAQTTSINSGTNYLSAILYDSNGKVAYYGNLCQISSATGTASITIPSGLTGTYTLALFEEEKCAANKTDYASTPVYAKFTVNDVDYETSATIEGSLNGGTTSAEVGQTITNNGLSAKITKLSGKTATSNSVFITDDATYQSAVSAGTVRNINTTSVEVTAGSSTFRVWAIYPASSVSSIENQYVAKSFDFNVNYEKSTSFAQTDSTKTTLMVNDTFTADMYTGTITWINGTTSSINSDDLYIVPASVWEGLSDAEKAESTLSGLSAYGNGKSITVTTDELNGADTYSIYTVYFPKKPGAASYHDKKFTYTSASLYATNISAECMIDEVDYGELITDSDIKATVILSGTGNSMEARQIYVLPSEIWDSLSDAQKQSESKLKKVTGVNSVVIPSESDLGGAEEYGLTVVYFDYSEQHASGNGVNCGNCNMYNTNVSVPLVSKINKEYKSYTKSGVTWYYQAEVDSEGKETGNAINVHTTNEDVKQYVGSDGALNVPAEVAGYKVKSIGSGTKARPFIPYNVNSFTSINFPDSVKTVNDYAFYGNTAFLRLTIPSTVASLGNFAFYDCDNISNVVIESTNLGVAAFGNCDGIVELHVSGTSSIGKVAFAECDNLKKVTIAGTCNIGKSAFVNDTALNALNLNGLVNSAIDAYAFKNCTNLRALAIPYSNQVKAYAFDGCSGITNLELDISTIENHSFERCYFIQYMIFGENVQKVEYDWGGYSNDLYENNENYGERLDTTIYVKNKGTLFECYREGTDIYSSFMGHYVEGGSYKYSRVIEAFVSGEGTTANEHSVDGTKTTATLAYYAAAKDDIAESTYTWWNYVSANGLLTVNMTTDANTGDASVTLDTKRDGITAYYDGKIYDNEKADKNKVIVNPIYSDASPAEDQILDFYFFDAEEADAAIRQWISDTDYEYKNVIPGKLVEDKVYAYSKYVEYYSDTATITEEELELQVKAMVQSVFDDKEFFLAATVGVRDNPKIHSVVSNQDYAIQHMMVIYYPNSDLEIDSDYNEAEPIYYLVGFDVKIITYTDEMGFFDAGFTYSNVMEKLNDLQENINALSEYVDTLEKSNDELTVNNVELSNQLSEARQQLSEYVTMYTNLLSSLNDYMGSTESDDTGYFGTKENPDTGEKTPIVWIDGNEAEYEETGNSISYNGKEYAIYIANVDLNGDSVKEEIKFFVADDGVHVIEKDGTSLDNDEVYSDTIKALERKMAAKLAELNQTLQNLSQKISDLKVLLGITDEDFDSLSQEEQLEIIKQYVEANITALNESNAKLESAQNNVKALEEILLILEKSSTTELTEEELSKLKLELTSQDKTVDLTELVGGKDASKTLKDLAQIIESGLKENGDKEAGILDKNTLDAIAEYNSSISTSLKSMSAEIELARGTIQTQLESIQANNATIEIYKQKLADMEAGNESDNAALLEQLNSLSTQVNELNARVTELSNQVLALQRESAAYEAMLSSIRTLLGVNSNEDIEAAIKALLDAQTENVANKKLISDIQSALNTTKTGSELVEVASATYKASLNGESGGSDYKTGFADGYKAGVASNNSSGDYSTGYNAGYMAGYATGSTNSDSASTSQIKSLTAQITSLTTENNDLSSKVASLKEDNTTLKDSNNTLTSKVTSLEDDIASLKTKNSRLNKTNKTLENKVTSLNNKLSSVNKDKTNLTSQVSTLKNQVSSLSSQLSNLKNNNSATSTASNVSSPSTVPSSAQVTYNATSSNKSSTEKTEENSIVKNSTLIVASSSGKVIERTLPTESECQEVNSVQKAVTNLIKLSEDNTVSFDTNASGYKETTAEQKESAYRILTYYINNLEELGEIGSTEIQEAAADADKEVSIEAIASLDIEASESQKEAIDMKENVDLILSSEVIENGELYLVVHESQARDGIFDVALVTADDGAISVELPDLSPVMLAKVSINESTTIGEESGDANLQLVAESVEPDENQQPANGIFRVVMLSLLVIVIAGLVIIFLFMKKGKSGFSRKK